MNSDTAKLIVAVVVFAFAAQLLLANLYSARLMPLLIGFVLAAVSGPAIYYYLERRKHSKSHADIEVEQLAKLGEAHLQKQERDEQKEPKV